MWFLSILMVSIFILIGVMSAITPMVSRQATPFGVTVAGKHDFVEERKRRFAFWSIFMSLVFALPLFVFPFIENTETAEMWIAIYTLIGTFLYLIFQVFLYLRYREQIKDWKTELPEVEQEKARRVVIDLNYHEKLHTKSHWTFFIWQAVIIIIPVILAFAFYDRIPAEIPINWNAQFEVNRTVAKSIWTVLALPGIQVLMIPVFNYSNHAIVRSKQKLSPLDPEAASEKSRRFRETWSNFTFAMTISTQLLFSFLFLYSLFSAGRWGWLFAAIMILYLVVTVGGSIYLTWKYGQAGEKLLETEEQYYTDPDEEDNWKFGVLYFNKEDPSVFVEKRFGVGTTFNYARWQAWAFIIGLLVFTVLMIVWSAWLT